MSATANIKQLESFVKAARRDYKVAEAYEPMNAINEFIYSFLLWNTTTTKANVAFKKFTSSFTDLNELRVTQGEDLTEMLGVQYPDLDERVQRLLASLKDVYNREHAVDLQSLTDMSKRDGRQYLETITGITPFVVSRMALVVQGGHAVPVDERMLESMIEMGLFPEETPAADASSALERVVRASDSAATYDAFQAWSDDGAPSIVKKAASSGSKKTTKKKTKRKTTRSS